MIEKNKIVSLIYELRENDESGNIIETIDNTRPLRFLYGTGKLIPSFEGNISELNPGDPFSFSIKSGEAYGERREEMIIDVPLYVFETEGKIDENICKVGNQVPMMDTSGNPLTGTILEISDESARMDFNHPMAGTDLYFSGKILDITDPTPEDLNPAGNSCSGCNPHDHGDCSGGCSC
jgi:FKBP-type peptidyl-prolyl cis-trans isomerase SlyD